MLYILAVALALLNLAVAQEWHFAWNESVGWNRIRDEKIAYAKTIAGKEVSEPSVSIPDGGTEGSGLIGGQPVYISLTTIANRLHLLSPTIQSIISGSVVPTMIYVFVSREPHLIDTGIQDSDLLNEDLNIVQLLDYFHNIKFVYTENIGPHRKVLPLLRHKLQEDCVIISVDDDHIYLHHWLRDMLAYYVHSQGQAIISTRARRIAICSGQHPYHVAPYMTSGVKSHTQWYEAAPHLEEMLLLPTGVGGVLYRPRFFNQALAFSRELWGHTLRADDLTFRLATLANRVPVYTACVHGDYKDHRLITECPPLKGVSFQHLARRRLEGSGLPLHLHRPALDQEGHSQAADSEGEREGEGPRVALRGKVGHLHQRHHLHNHQQQVHDNQQRQQNEDGIGQEATQRQRTADGAEDPEQRRISVSVRGRSGGEKRAGALRGAAAGVRRGAGAGSVTWYRNLYILPAGGANYTSTDAIVANNSTNSDAEGGQASAQGAASVPAPPPAVYNRTRLLVLNPNLRPPPKNIDHGKQGSLSGINSKRDGNFHQWNKATEFLRQRGLFDVDALVQQYVRREREHCLATTLLIGYDNSTWLGSVVGALATSAQTVREGWTEQRCGVVTCSSRGS